MADDSFAFDPSSVNLTTADPRDVICFLNAGANEYNGRLGARVSALFVLLITSSLATFFPVVATRLKRVHIPLYVYLFARYFGAGVIIATAFIHLLDPAYGAIGPASCVGMTGAWASYTWPPCLAMAMVMLTFLLDFLAEWYVDKRYKLAHGHDHDHGHDHGLGHGAGDTTSCSAHSHQFLHSADQDTTTGAAAATAAAAAAAAAPAAAASDNNSDDIEKARYGTTAHDALAFREQIAAFLVLEFGVIFHSVIIGLNLGVVGDEFSTLYPVIVFHQAFEGLGLGARLSAIPFPRSSSTSTSTSTSPFLKALPWLLCAAYSLTTPVALAVGLGLRTTYNGSSFTANVVSGVLDSISAGILLYTGLVELLARDFLFNPQRTRDGCRLSFMLGCLFLGVAIMALLGKWA